MYTKMLITLDGSTTAEKVLPYARFLSGNLKLPVELTTVFDIAEVAAGLSTSKARHLNTMIEDIVRNSFAYLKQVSTTFPAGNVVCTVEKGRAEDVIIAKAEADPAMLIAMATHGRSGINRWLLGSVAEKVLRATFNPLFLVKATEQIKTAGVTSIKSIVVPLDGSEIAESVLPMVAGLAKKLALEVVLFRVYNRPSTVYGGVDGYYVPNLDELLPELESEARSYLESKGRELKNLGINNVSYEVKEGFSADEIIRFAHSSPNTFVAMCSHGRSGVRRWALGSVAETVVRHSDEPVLIVRPS
jgi:nucleotide-binding universal stress UspA family protein